MSCLPCLGLAAVKLAPPFSDNMVLQRGMLVPVWGMGKPGEAITVKFRDQTKQAKAGPDGRWVVKLDALEVGAPAMLEVSGTNTLRLANVLVGEVWIGSGQSNMENAVLLHSKADPELAEAAKGVYPHLRLLAVKDGVFGTWQEASPQAIAHFSAMLFFFGTCLDKELNVPLGLVVTAQGGTSSEQWIAREAFDGSAACQAALARSQKEQAAESDPAQIAGALRANTRMGEHFQANIVPLLPLAFRAMLWDQGENGTGIVGVDQFSLMSALVADWRKAWGRDFPFIYLQKPSGGGPGWSGPVAALPEKPPKLKEGLERELYSRMLQIPGTAMVVTSDLRAGIHPEDKSDYARRAAMVALDVVYGKSREIYGPMYRSHAVEGGKVRLSFDHVGQGLVAAGGAKLQGFAIAGADGKFHWADALIEGDTVVVSHPQVPQPVTVRYAWSAAPGWANLFNREELPALSFRTDE